MHALAADRLEFAPPPPPGRLRALGLALLAHALLTVALTWGVSWRSDRPTPAVEAELWSAVPQQAAPPQVAPPEPEPTPAPAPPPPKADPGPSAADIALAREKERKLKEQQAQEQQAQEQRREKEREKERLAQQKREHDKKLAEDKKKKELEAQRREKEEAKKIEKLRQENLQRMAGLAGASGTPSSSGNALKSAGPSASYAGRIVGRVRPNIVFTEDVVGNPSAEVEVRSSPDGTIVGTKLVKSSGSKAWDDAVLKALVKTEVLPRDTDGRVPSPLIISFRPRD